MSVIAPKAAPQEPAPQDVRKAARVINGVGRMAAQMIQQWEQTFDAVWAAPNPQEILDEIQTQAVAKGSNAAELMELSGAMVQFFAAILPGKRQEDLDRIMAKVSAMPAVTVDPTTGAVTITVE